jgi:hypothetical protein
MQDPRNPREPHYYAVSPRLKSRRPVVLDVPRAPLFGPQCDRDSDISKVIPERQTHLVGSENRPFSGRIARIRGDRPISLRS